MSVDLKAALSEAERVYGAGHRIELHDGLLEAGVWTATVHRGDGARSRTFVTAPMGASGRSEAKALSNFVVLLAMVPSHDGTPSRGMIDCHAEHGGYWLVSRVRSDTGNVRPDVLQMRTEHDLLHAESHGEYFGRVWYDDPFRAMKGSRFTPLTTDGEKCEACL